MDGSVDRGSSPTARGNHFSCSFTALLMARIAAFGGDPAVRELLLDAGSHRPPEYLLETSNWISYDEAVALWRAGARITRHPQFARALGEEAGRRLNGSPVAALLRSLGSPEEVYRQMATTSTKFSTVTNMKAVEVRPGFAEIIAVAVDGFPRDADHCAWSCGLLTQAPVLFGLPPAIVEHDDCAVLGAPHCRYQVIWDVDAPATSGDCAEQVQTLREQLEAMKERLQSMFATAADLIGAGGIDEVLARITDRAAVEVRAPRHLLAVRTSAGGELHCHHRGFPADEVEAYAERILNDDPATLPESWLVVPVCSNRTDYGCLLAMYDGGRRFFAQERDLLEVYARYAASALDSATALMQASALLDLARALASAGTTGEVALRLADAVPLVVDCDRVGVYLWDADDGQIVRRAVNHRDAASAVGEDAQWSRAPTSGGPLERLLDGPQSEPLFVNADEGDPLLRELFTTVGAVASILVPIASRENLLGLLAVSVLDAPERLKPSPELLDRLSGVVAQATTALQNGRLLDQITQQALHDELTGLANRAQFNDEIRGAINQARRSSESVTLFYIDLDGFKPVNDKFGHDLGDEVLVSVAGRLSSCTRAGDTVARLGGDEFAVLMVAETGGRSADALFSRLIAAFDTPFLINGQELHVGASVGRASFPADADDAESLLCVGDAAMFDNKRSHHEAAPGLIRRR